MLVTAKEILKKAQAGKYAVGAFNVANLETVKAVISAATRSRSPVIMQTSEGAIRYAGVDYLCELIKLASKTSVPVVLHLDHGLSVETVELALEHGYTSVMIDGSKLPYEENVKLTKYVVDLAKRKKVSVEGELGQLGGREEAVSGKIKLTDPEQAKEFVKRTGVDSLAIAIGTSHGPYKFKGIPHLDLDRLSKIKNLVEIPLVLHGASTVDQNLVKAAVRLGVKLEGAQGVPEKIIKDAIRLGISKINIDTELQLVSIIALRRQLSEHPEEFKLYKILQSVMDALDKHIENKMIVFGSAGKA